jgi:hypothetical protein
MQVVFESWALIVTDAWGTSIYTFLLLKSYPYWEEAGVSCKMVILHFDIRIRDSIISSLFSGTDPCGSLTWVLPLLTLPSKIRLISGLLEPQGNSLAGATVVPADLN